MDSFKIFISWSGKTSQRIAHRLCEWLPSIIPKVEPFYSSNIPGGSMWLQDIADNLATAEMGLICVTRDNVNSRWLNFEAGALWNRFDAGIRICPILYDLAASDLGGPLSHFQSKQFNEEDMKALCRQLAEKTGLSRERVDISFKAIWPKLQDEVTSDLRNITTPGQPLESEPPPVNDAERPFEVAALEIMSYLNHNGFDMVSFDRIREKIDETYTNEFLMSVIKKFPEKFRRATLKGDVPGIGKAKL